jgi:hypothetical protein
VREFGRFRNGQRQNVWSADVVRFRSAIRASADCNLLKARGEVLVSQIFTSWNALTSWLRQIEHLRSAA